MRRFGRTTAFGITLVASTAVLAPAGAADAKPSGHLSVRAVWPSVTTLGVVAVAGNVTAATVPVHLVLQRKSGGHWTTVDRATVGTSGRYSFLLRSPVQPAIWHLRVVRAAPTQVSGEVTVRVVAAPSGVVKAWGDNSDATLGDGSRQNSLTPVTVSGLTGVVAVASAQDAGYALRSDGTVWSWGDDAYGARNYSTAPLTGLPDVPTMVAGVSGVTAIAAAGGGSGFALRGDGTVWSWGYNQSGELGNGNRNDSVVPRPIRGLAHIVAISGGYQDGYALRSDGTVWGWGYDGANELGVEPSLSADLSELRPVRVDGVSDAVAIAGGTENFYVLRSDGTVWGAGILFGAADHSYPPPKAGPPPELGQVPGLRKITAIAAGSYGGWALRADGTVMGWGINGNGEIGDGTQVDHLTTPVPVKGLAQVTALCQDYGLTGCALRRDGTEWIWGDNEDGTLGDGNVVNRPAPGPIPSLTGVLAIAQGDYDGYALVRP